MKTTHRSVARAAAVLATLLFTISCTTSQKVAYQETSSPQQLTAAPSDWYQVSNDPPVSYPVGVPEDAETNYRHGDWIFAGEGDAMWFVPFEGSEQHSEVELRRQAFAMRTDAQKRAPKRDNFREKVTQVVGTTITGTLTVATVAVCAYVSNGYFVPDPSETFISFENDLESSQWNDLLHNVRFREDLYPAEVLVEYNRSKSGSGGSAPGASDTSDSSLTSETNTLLFQHTNEVEGASFLDKWNRSTGSPGLINEITYPE